MANDVFDREIINVRERPLSSDINLLASQMDRTLRDLLLQAYLGRVSVASDASAAPIGGFIGDSLKVRPVSPVALKISVTKGLGFIYDIAQDSDIDGVSSLNDLSQWKPVVLMANAEVVLSAAPTAPNSRYDIIEMRVNRVRGESTSRDVLNPLTGKFEPGTVNKNLGWTLDGSIGTVVSPANSTAALSVKFGVAGNPPTEPSVSPGYTKIGRVLVGSAVASVDADMMQDTRRILVPHDMIPVSTRFTLPNVNPPVPVTSVIRTPPGIVVAIVGREATTRKEADLYIFPGGALTTLLPSVVASLGYVSGLNQATAMFATPTAVTVDSTLQTELAGSNASPQVKVAIGQTGWKIKLESAASGVGVVTCQADTSING
jgi:hypothetical protein